MLKNEWDDQYGSPWAQDLPMGATPDPLAGPVPGATASPVDTAPAPTPGPTPDPQAPQAYPTPTGPTASPEPVPGGTQRVQQPDYTSYLADLQAAPDPRSQAVARDALARQLQQDLEADGHKVSWKGGQMIVDGRPYELGGGDASTGGWTDQPTASAGPAEQMPLTPTGAGQSSGAPPAGSVSSFTEQSFLDASRNYQGTAAGLAKLIADHPEWGAQIRGSKGDKFVLPDGSQYDAIYSAGDPTQSRFQLLRIAGPGGVPIASASSPTWGAGANDLLTYGNNLSDLPSWLTADTTDPELKGLADSIPGVNDVYSRIAGADPTEGQTQGLVENILAHPESLDERTVQTLKGQSAEEAALAAQAQDEDLQHFGAGANLQDSPWLAASRGENQWNRRNATIQANRQIDIAAGNQNAADRRAAAQLGTSYGNYRTSKVQQAVTTAVETGLAKGTLTQAAKQLGLTKNSLLINYIGAHVGAQLDMKKLALMSDQFKEELAYRISALKQADEQFQSNFGLAMQEFQHRKDQDYWDRAQQLYAPR